MTTIEKQEAGIEQCNGLIYEAAFDFFRRERGAVEFSDLVQEGRIGVAHAVEKCEERSTCKFSSYAAWWIRGYMMNFCRKNRSAVRHKGIERLSVSMVEIPDLEGEDCSYNFFFREQETVRSQVDLNLFREATLEALEELSERERIVITMRFFEDEMQPEIARQIGISHQAVCVLEKKALQKLARLLRGWRDAA